MTGETRRWRRCWGVSAGREEVSRRSVALGGAATADQAAGGAGRHDGGGYGGRSGKGGEGPARFAPWCDWEALSTCWRRGEAGTHHGWRRARQS
jgi:hypothetical protein